MYEESDMFNTALEANSEATGFKVPDQKPFVDESKNEQILPPSLLSNDNELINSYIEEVRLDAAPEEDMENIK